MDKDKQTAFWRGVSCGLALALTASVFVVAVVAVELGTTSMKATSAEVRMLEKGQEVRALVTILNDLATAYNVTYQQRDGICEVVQLLRIYDKRYPEVDPGKIKLYDLRVKAWKATHPDGVPAPKGDELAAWAALYGRIEEPTEWDGGSIPDAPMAGTATPPPEGDERP